MSLLVDDYKKDEEDIDYNNVNISENVIEVQPGGDSFFAPWIEKASYSFIWITFVYWTILVWITYAWKGGYNVPEVTIWAIGSFFGLTSCYTLYHHEWPSGGSEEDEFSVKSRGRWTSSTFTLCVMIDVLLIVYYSSIGGWYRVQQLLRLSFHLCHLVFASLFHLNQYQRTSFSMAYRAYTIEWFDLIWTAIIAEILCTKYIQNESIYVDYVYFLFVVLKFAFWMIPMLYVPFWGSPKFGHKTHVPLQLLALDMLDIAVIIALLYEFAYNRTWILWCDVFWKSFVVIQAISKYLIGHLILGIPNDRTRPTNAGNAIHGNDGTFSLRNLADKYSALVTTDKGVRSWAMFTTVYWTVLTCIYSVNRSEIGQSFVYYLWGLAMIGIFLLHDCVISEHFGRNFVKNTFLGKCVMGYCVLCVIVCWIMHSAHTLEHTHQFNGTVVAFCVLHAISVLWAVLFYYGNALRNGLSGSRVMAVVMLLSEWVDCVFMMIVIFILHFSVGPCLDTVLCQCYFAFFVIQLFVWTYGILFFGGSDTDLKSHMHVIILDSITDLPILIILLTSASYNLHPFFIVDIVYKLVLLSRSYGYSLIGNMILKRHAIHDTHDMQLKKNNEINNMEIDNKNSDDDDTEFTPLKNESVQ